jgi:hypothetical protein
MINFVEMIFMGIWATLFMDISAIIFGKLKIIHPTIGPEIVGRWALYMVRGKFVHKDINKTPALSNEKSAALIAHYLIGIILAGIYLVIEPKIPITLNQPWMPLIFGIATTVLPWFWLYPSIGLGIMASKTSKRSPFIVTSLVNHTNFGLGFLIWIVFFRRLLT